MKKTTEELEEMMRDAEKSEDWLLAAVLCNLIACRLTGKELALSDLLLAFNTAVMISEEIDASSEQYQEWLEKAGK